MMGCHPNIGFDKYPKQGGFAGRRVSVCFNYNTEARIEGVIVRSDYEDPFLGIIALDDGRFVLMTECHYMPLPLDSAKEAS